MSSTQSERSLWRDLVRNRDSLAFWDRGILRRDWWSARKSILIAYLSPAFIVAFLVNTWFRTGAFIAGQDIAPFIRTSMAAELGSMWGYSIVGAGSPSYRPTAAMPELVMLGATRLLGLSEETGQRLFYMAVVIALVVSTTFFVRAFVSRSWVGAVSGLLVFFNPFVLQTMPSVLALVATAMMAAVGGLVLRAAKGQNVSAFALAAVLAVSGYVALNPAFLAIAALWTIALAALGTAFFGEGGTRRGMGLLVRTAPWALLLNLWWIVPYVVTLLKASATEVIAPRTVFEMSGGGHARLNLANVVSLSGLWAWGRPRAFPYAASLDRLPWGLLKFAIPVLALLSVFAVRRNRLRPVIVLIGLSLPLLFVGKGLHEPLTSANLFLYRHLPGMWLLRNPLSKVAPAILLAYVALVAMALDSALARWGRSKSISRLIPWSMMALVGAALIYPTPLWTGQVIRDKEPPSVFSRYIRIPDAWSSVAQFVNALPGGKVLVLPVARYYTFPTTWGYHGVDHIPRLMLKQPTIQVRRQGVYNEQPNFSSLLETLQSSLAAGNTAKAMPRFQALGVNYVIVRRDVPTKFPSSLPKAVRGRMNADYRPIEASLRASPEVMLLLESDVATVFQLRGDNLGFIGTGEPSNASIRWRRVGASKYEVEVPPTKTGLILELRDAFDRGWRLEGLPEGRRAEHVVAHEYANAWRISPGGAFEARISYALDRLYYVAIAISVITALTASALIVMRRRRSTARESGDRRNGPSQGDV